MESKLIRGPKLEVLNHGPPQERRPYYEFPFIEALRIAERGRRVLASNARMTRWLCSELEHFGNNAVFWTGTMTGYKWSGEKLGATIEYVDPDSGKRWVFPVPPQFRGEKDCILVVEHPDYTLEEERNNVIVQAVDEGKVDLVKDFPTRPLGGGAGRGDWHYGVNWRHYIPCGNPMLYGPVRLLNTDHRVGPVTRFNFMSHNDESRCTIGLAGSPSASCSLIVEAQ